MFNPTMFLVALFVIAGKHTNDVDLQEAFCAINLDDNGYVSSREPLQVQFTTTQQTAGSKFGDFEVGLEIGQCKTVSVHLALLAAHDIMTDPASAPCKDEAPQIVKDGNFLEAMRWVLRSFQRMTAVFEECDSLADLKLRALHSTYFHQLI